MLALLGAVAASSIAVAEEPPVQIEDPTVMWVPQIGQVPHAGFFRVTNTGDAAVNLAGARSSHFSSVDFHAEADGDLVLMEDLEMPIAIEPGETRVFKRGGPNLMMSVQSDWLEPGDTVEIELLFDGFDPLPVTFTVRKVQHGNVSE
jgi:copper(I)-binding protein